MKNQKLKVILFILFTVYCLLFTEYVFAQQMSSENFQIQGGNFNLTSGNKTSTNFRLSDVVGQTAAGVFTSKGYIIQAGFLNQALGEIFIFTVSPTVIDFGLLTANTPVIRQAIATITNGNVPGYIVSVSENQPLSTGANAEIPDTVCDIEQSAPCTTTQASPWNTNTSYGFGYNMTGLTVPQDFRAPEYFRPFPATRRNEQASIIMQSQARKVSDSAAMNLRVVISQNQPVGQYRNVLSFTALAGI